MKDFFSKLLERIKRLTAGQIVFLAISLALAVGAFFLVREMTVCWQITTLPGVAPARCFLAPEPRETPVPDGTGATPEPDGPTPTAEIAAPEAVLPDPWDGASRVTVLLLGLDYTSARASDGPPLSDTMILLTIDPATKTAGMLSIPRDMWVNVPGFGYNKINAAYQLGEAARLPGGGGDLARKTVEQFLGVPVQYYAQVDFQVFTRMIDEIGGVKIDVTEPISIDLMGGEDPIKIQPGRYTLPGDYALAYARARNTAGGDVDRARRQQQVILAIRDRLLEPGNFPALVAAAPTLYAELQTGIKWNMSLNDALRLAVLAKDVPLASIKRGVIDTTMFVYATSPDGLSINKPIPDMIRVLRDEIFTSGGALSPMAGGDLAAQVAAESARIQVLNASYLSGLAQSTGSYLASQGLNVTGVGSSTWSARTTIVLHSGKPYTLRLLMQILPGSSQISFQYDPAAVSDIDIYVGEDWVLSKPFP